MAHQDRDRASAANNVDLVSEEFLRFLESRGAITSRQISVLKNHRSPHRQLALFKNIVTQKDVQGFQAFCRQLLSFECEDGAESIDIRVPEASSTDYGADSEIRSDRPDTLGRVINLPSVTPERRPRVHSALRSQNGTPRPSTAGPQSRASINIQGISYDWNQTNQLEQLQKENAKLLLIIRESMSGLLKDIRDKDAKIAEMQKELRQNDSKLVELEQKNLSLEEKLKVSSSVEATPQQQTQEQDKNPQQASDQLPPWQRNGPTDQVMKKVFLAVFMELPKLFKSIQELGQHQVTSTEKQMNIATHQLDLNESRIRELENLEDPSLREKRQEHEENLRKATEESVQAQALVNEHSRKMQEHLFGVLKSQFPAVAEKMGCAVS